MLKSRPLAFFGFAYLLSLAGAVPVVLMRLQGQTLLSPPASVAGFLMTFAYWTAQTFILVGISEGTWRHLSGQRLAARDFMPSGKSFWQLLVWASVFSLFIFGVGSVLPYVLLRQSAGVARAVPVLPILFYFVAFIPLLIVDHSMTTWKAISAMYGVIKRRWFGLVKLTAAVEVLIVGLGVIGIGLEDSLGLSLPILVDHLAGNVGFALGYALTGCMIAVAYASSFITERAHAGS